MFYVLPYTIFVFALMKYYAAVTGINKYSEIGNANAVKKESGMQ